MHDATQASSKQATPKLPGHYINHKGNPYEVLGFGRNTDTEEPFVIYQALYGDYRVWTRPEAIFYGDVIRDGVPVPRITYAGPQKMRRLSQDGQLAGRSFLLAQGRPLEQAVYLFAFEAGSVDAVYEALAAYQNADGGFGKGLEPDLQTPDSSALATSVALQTLRHVHADARNPLVQGAISWLLQTFDHEHDCWQFIPDTANNAPHAPWWTADEDHPALFGNYLINPRIELLGYLHDYPELVPADFLAPLTERALAHIDASAGKMNMHDLLAAKRFVGSQNLPEGACDRVANAMIASFPKVVASSAEEWNNYGLAPTAIAQHPHSLFAEVLAQSIQHNLDYLIDQQQDDGAWHPMWTWGDLYPAQWQAAQHQWQSAITLESLLVLRDWGRFAL